jgi:small subunit ribosomal protein S16
MGAKKKPFYRLVAADSRFPRDGRFIEVLGTYDPKADPAGTRLEREKIQAWVDRGAALSATVKSLLKKNGIPIRPAGKSAAAAPAEEAVQAGPTS